GGQGGGAPAPAAPPAGRSVPAPPPSPEAGQDPAGPSPTGHGEAGPVGVGAPPSRDELVKAWGDTLLASLKGRARSLYRAGHFVTIDETGTAVFAVPNEPHRQFAEDCRREVEQAISAHFGVRVPLRLVVEADPVQADGGAEAEDEMIDITELAEAAPGPATPEDRLREAFPGATEVEP
ncbi:MAG TPA: hypothetical protein VFH45_01730, partial [Acidimicrobiales bacterium]|nr:hypothetical protein [Acidimicrobiales bacterium]